MDDGLAGFAMDFTAFFLLTLEARRRNDLMAGMTFALGACIVLLVGMVTLSRQVL